MSEKFKLTHCLNCKTPFPEAIDVDREIYCSHCGQSSKDSKLSFIRLIKDAISNIFNLDSRLIHTFRDLIYPSKLTSTYIEGQRKYYVNPVRLFIFILIALITLSLYCIKLDNSAMGADRIYSKAERSKLLEEYNDLIDTLEISGHESMLDSVKSRLFYNVTTIKEDTLGINGPQIFSLGKDVESFGISNYDGIHLSQNELFKKYEITDFWDKLNVGQYIRLVTNPVGGIKHIVKNLTWAVFITVLLMSFFMKLLYIRKNYYLVEHLVLILNSHSLLFILSAINLIILTTIDFDPLWDGAEAIVFGVTFLIIIIIQFLTLKKYYKQGTFKTLVKQSFINTAYLIIFNLSVIMVALISLILY